MVGVADGVFEEVVLVEELAGAGLFEGDEIEVELDAPPPPMATC